MLVELLSDMAREQLMAEAYAEAQRRLAAEEAASRVNSLIEFAEYTHPDYIVEPMHQLIGDTLDGVLAGDIPRLMIYAPPQHGKSELVSVKLPAYSLGTRPHIPIILSSYGAELAETHSRHCRDLVESEVYERIFPEVKTNRNSRAVDRWELKNNRGSLRAIGAGGPITGHGAGLGIIDDPHANWEEAQSPTYREKVWSWWKGTFRPRIWKNGAIILIMTRWHPDDLAGRILNSDGGSKWKVLRLPAIAEDQKTRADNCIYLHIPVETADPLGRNPGEPLSPTRYGLPEYEDIRQDAGSTVFAAEYQGVPRNLEGTRFKRAWFSEFVTAIPTNLTLVRYWDKAGSTGAKSAYTAGVLLGVAPDGLIYIIDVVRGRWTAGEREKTIKSTAETDRQRFKARVRTYVEQEPGSGGKESAENTIKNLAGYNVYKDPPVGNKDARLEPFAAQAEAGNVRMVIGPWNHEYIEEMVAIVPGDKGEYRDQADGTSGAFNRIVIRSGGGKRSAHRGLPGRNQRRAG